MKNLSLHLIEKGEDKSDIPEKISNLAQVLHHSTKPNQHLLVYTDGSTETRKRKSKNSGYGICIPSSTHWRNSPLGWQQFYCRNGSHCDNQSTSSRPNHDHVDSMATIQ